MRFVRSAAVLVSVIVATVLLSSCASHPNEYLKKGKQVNGLVVPPGIPMIKQDTYYPVPNSSQPTAQKPASIVPPTIQ